MRKEISDEGFPALLLSPFHATGTVKAEKKRQALNIYRWGNGMGKG